jgi:hypothetical protein
LLTGASSYACTRTRIEHRPADIAKLRAIGCDLDSIEGYAHDDAFEFAPSEMEFLARMEHDRWAEERFRAGWRFGPVQIRSRRPLRFSCHGKSWRPRPKSSIARRSDGYQRSWHSLVFA